MSDLSDEDFDWELPSNDDWVTVYGRVLGQFSSGRGQYVVMCIRVIGRYWDVLGLGANEYQLVESSLVHLKQAAVRLDRLKELLQLLFEWQRSRSDFSIALADGNALQITVAAEKNNSVLARDKPSCRVDFDAARIAGSTEFTVDPSCIDILYRGLSATVARVQARLASPGDSGAKA